MSWMCTTKIIRDGKKMQRISRQWSSKESRGGNAAGGKSKRGNYKPGAAIVGKETFFGSIVKALVSKRGQDARALGAKCSVEQHSASS